MRQGRKKLLRKFQKWLFLFRMNFLSSSYSEIQISILSNILSILYINCEFYNEKKFSSRLSIYDTCFKTLCWVFWFVYFGFFFLIKLRRTMEVNCSYQYFCWPCSFFLPDVSRILFLVFLFHLKRFLKPSFSNS